MENGSKNTTKGHVGKYVEKKTTPRRVFIELLVSRFVPLLIN